MKLKLIIAAAIALLLIGFWAGRATLPVKERVEYIQLPAVSGSLSGFDLTPISEVMPATVKFIPVYTALPTATDGSEAGAPAQDAVSEEIGAHLSPGPVHGAADGVANYYDLDTLAGYRATVEDWNLIRIYAKTLFDTPELGKLSIRAAIQYNAIDSLDWDFTPMQRTTTRIERSLWQPFASVGYNTFEQGSIGAGAFYKNIGLQLHYIRDFRGQRNAVGAEVMIKF